MSSILKNWWIIALLLAMPLSITSCGDDDDDDVKTLEQLMIGLWIEDPTYQKEENFSYEISRSEIIWRCYDKEQLEDQATYAYSVSGNTITIYATGYSSSVTVKEWTENSATIVNEYGESIYLTRVKALK